MTGRLQREPPPAPRGSHEPATQTHWGGSARAGAQPGREGRGKRAGLPGLAVFSLAEEAHVSPPGRSGSWGEQAKASNVCAGCSRPRLRSVVSEVVVPRPQPRDRHGSQRRRRAEAGEERGVAARGENAPEPGSGRARALGSADAAGGSLAPGPRWSVCRIRPAAPVTCARGWRAASLHALGLPLRLPPLSPVLAVR